MRSFVLDGILESALVGSDSAHAEDDLRRALGGPQAQAFLSAALVPKSSDLLTWWQAHLRHSSLWTSNWSFREVSGVRVAVALSSRHSAAVARLRRGALNGARVTLR